MRTAIACALLLTALPALGEPAAAPTGPVELRVVNYRDLSAAIRNLRGQVVVVDVWANY